MLNEAFLRAAEACDEISIEQLLRVKASPDAVHHATGGTALHLVAAQLKTHESVQAFRLLVDSGCNLFANDVRGRTPLYVAARCGDASTLKALVYYLWSWWRVQKFLAEKTFNSLLVELARSGHLEAVKTLIRAAATRGTPHPRNKRKM